MRLSLPQHKTNKHISLAIAIVLLLVGYVFAIRGVSMDTIRRDEHTTLGHIGALDDGGLTLTETIDSLQAVSTQHPPFYFFVANLWGQVTSYQVFTLRFLSVLLGMLSFALVYRLAYDIGGHLVARYALLMMVTSMIYIFYTHDMRQYMLLTSCLSLMLLMYRRLAYTSKSHKLWQLALLTLASLGAIYTHYSAMFLLFPLGAYHLLFAPKNRGWLHISGAMIVAGLLFVPWLPTVVHGALDIASEAQTGEVTVFTNIEVAELAMLYWGNGERLLFISLMGLSLLAVVLNQRGSRYALFFVVATIITVGIMNEYLEFVEWMRYILVFTIPFSIFVGYGFMLVHRTRILIPVIIVFMIVWTMSGTNFQTTKEFADETQIYVPAEWFIEFHRLMPLIADMPNDDTILVPVVFHYGMTRDSKQGKMSIQDYYLQNIDMPYVNLNSGRLVRDPLNLPELVETVEAYSSIWLTYPIRDMYNIRQFLKPINENYELCQTAEYGTRSVLEHYVKIDQFDTHCAAEIS